jgi:hypothetical protein
MSALEASLIASTTGWRPTTSDVATALRLTGKDPKGDHAAARNLLDLGQDALREADAALRVEAPGWTLHWSNSQGKFFYAHKARRIGPFSKADECPFVRPARPAQCGSLTPAPHLFERCPHATQGWAADGDAGSASYFHVARPDEKKPTAPQKKRSLGTEDATDVGGDPSKRLKLAAGATTKSVASHGWHNGEGPLVKWNPVPEGWEQKSLAERVRDLCALDDRVGYPAAVQPVEKNPHGWFFPPHKVVMANIMGPHTKW